MKENGQSPPETVVCGRCADVCEPDDNFCRSCGMSLREQYLPAVSSASLPAVWRPSVTNAVVKGAAYVAAGKVAEMLLRRLVRGAWRRAPVRALVPSRKAAAPEVVADAGADDAQVVSDTLFVRRVRIRR